MFTRIPRKCNIHSVTNYRVVGTRVVHENAQSRVQRHNAWVQNKPGMTKRRKLKPPKCLFNLLVDYCNQSSLHGLKYVGEPGTHWIKRLIWSFLFTLSVIATVIVICKLAARFQAAQTSTVVETTNYPVSELSFPSVTLCPGNRVDWQKALKMEKDIFPTHDQTTVQTYRDLLTTLSTITFGDFDDLDFLQNRSLEAFNGINLTELLRSVAPTCPEILNDCWWRDSERDCCEIFEPQGTEIGLCHSFNSETANFDKVTYSKELRPRRSNLMGDWSGLRFQVKLNKSHQPPGTTEALGVTTYVGHPRSWLSNGRKTGIGMMASIAVQCPSTYATKSVLELGKGKLPCRPDDGTLYNRDYCMTLCRRSYIIKLCGCNPSFMMPKGAERDCTVKDLLCLSKENDIFNKYVSRGNPYFPENDSGMNCTCLPECELFDYQSQFTHTALRPSIASDTIFIDVHYESTTMMRYRMDIVHTRLDLLVSFGGIVGLFLGGSILSLIELLYYLAIGLISQIFRRSKAIPEPARDLNQVKSRKELEPRIATVNTVLPLLDYCPNPRMSLNKY